MESNSSVHPRAEENEMRFGMMMSIYDNSAGDAVQIFSQSLPGNPPGSLDDFTLFLDMALLPDRLWGLFLSDGGNLIARKEDETRLPLDLILFDKDAKTGFLAFKYLGTKTTSPQAIRIDADPDQLVLPAADSEFGQYNAYDANWRAFYPNAGFNDRTQFLNHLTMTNQVDATCLAAGPMGNEGIRYAFIDATNNYGRATASVPGTYPMTLVIAALLAVNDALPCFGLRDQSAPDSTNAEITANRNASVHRTDAGNTSDTALASEAQSDTLATATVWRHIAGVFASSTSRTAYLAGGNDGNDPTEILIGSGVLDEIVVGKGSRSGITSNSTPNTLSIAQVHDVARTADWVAYQAAMLDQATFWGAFD
jgi:hypothetical protein